MPIIEANRFSRFVRLHDRAGYQDLVKWEHWFTSRGFPCAIVVTDKGYALYRLGLAEEE